MSPLGLSDARTFLLAVERACGETYYTTSDRLYGAGYVLVLD